ncbi:MULTISPECIES: polysaccharide deacetylase family protein [unclassified Beijerinckia]|uniref:polysaccharide deacetylase family protein n=1 Tax=unclassified Beijerinckia TaxID=2638183 RepID=UPI00089D672D|nr:MULTISPECIES: polysaccharide deacetylase family protein [unclassified Beijerinckia]MDH7794766.1 peptidoglycan/xylan/chitin deacetylase (PgdA/CDA1 family) [Beijerinckia sp. GAS462]SEB74378.1 Peptidoglycan/xylan/chitin deacetylase, PgdA/CDA1 family [Beijerinckia sp. 28-YEA-48]
MRASVKEKAIAAGFAVFRATGLHRAARFARGSGVILMFHHVRPWAGQSFAPNRLLEITPEFLNTVIETLRGEGFDIVSLDQAVERLGRAQERPFAVLTFDDGYKDNLEHALPILRRHQAPFTLYVTTGFAERTARLWWVELEEAIRALDRIEVEIDGTRLTLECRSDAEKAAAFRALYWPLRSGSEQDLLDRIAGLAERAGIAPAAIVERLCLDWDGLRQMAADPLCTIGVHTLTHPMLAKHDDALVRRELADSRAIIEREIGRPARHLAYPVGDPTSAGPREFALAAELGFASAVTTRPGMLFPDHAAHLTALPRLSVNGNWQDRTFLEVLLSGAPFALWNRGRRVNAA